MDLILAFSLFISSVILTLYYSLPMSLAMSAGFVLFMFTGLHRGFTLRSLLAMSWKGAKSSLIVVRVLLTIGIMTGLWRSAGTFAVLVAWGMKAVTPSMFVLAAFVLSCMMSYALGTSFGTAGTLGVALMTLARSGGADPVITSGAIMSGIHFGDRGSPSSSCLHLVSALTGTEIYPNVRAFMKSAVIPLIISLAFYLVMSLRNSIGSLNPDTITELSRAFVLSPLAVIPAVLMIALPLLHVNIFIAFMSSIIAAFVLSITLQSLDMAGALEVAVFGLHSDGGIKAVFNGGGLVSMLQMCLVLVISGTFSGIFDGTGMLSGMQGKISHIMQRWGAYPVILAVSTLMDAVFCNQTAGVIMSVELFRKPCDDSGMSRESLALDLANSGVITAPLVPCCIACSVPLSMLGEGLSALPYACYLYLIPCAALVKSFAAKKNRASHS